MTEVFAAVLYIMFAGTVMPHQSFVDMDYCEAARVELAERAIVPAESSLCVPLIKAGDR